MSALADLGRDLALALRSLRQHPGFTTTALVVLALAIGAGTAIFSVVDALVLRPLPFPAADRLVTIHTRDLASGRIGPVSWPDMTEVREQRALLAELAVYRPRGLVLAGPGDAETVRGVIASVDLWRVLGVQPVLGRAFSPGEDQAGQPRVAVVSHGFWRRKLGGDPAALGRTLILDGAPHTVVGVAPRGFRFPLDDSPAEVWVPLDGGIDREARRWRSMLPYRSAIARLRPGVTVAETQAALDVLRAAQARAHPTEDGGSLLVVRSFHEEWVQGGRPALLVLLGAVVLLILIACANVAGLQLARTVSRERELAIRRALGAGRGRLVRLLLTESLVLTTTGALLGVGLAYLGLELLVAAIPPQLARPHAIAIDGRVLAGAVAGALVSGLLVGVGPALLATRAGALGALTRAHQRTRGRAQALLLVGEIALAVVLLIGAGLLLRSFARLSAIAPGFDGQSLLIARIKTTARQIKGEDLFRQLRAGLGRLPGAESAAITSPLPFVGQAGGTLQFTIAERPPPPAGEPWWLLWQTVSPEYFATLRIPLLRGRQFQPSDDRPDAPEVALVNEAFARRHFAGSDPLGRRVLAYGRYDWRIIGVVADTRGTTCPRSGCDGQVRLEQPAEPTLYTSLGRGCCPPDLHVAIRHPTPMAAAPSLRAMVREIDPNLPVEHLHTMEEAIGGSLAGHRLNLSLLGAFAALALTLALVGIHGLLSFSMAQRHRELAIRMALGARAVQVLRAVTAQGVRLAVMGVAGGIGGALALTHVLQSQLHEVSPTDPVIFLALALGLPALAAAVSLLTARQATRIDPMVALRHE